MDGLDVRWEEMRRFKCNYVILGRLEHLGERDCHLP